MMIIELPTQRMNRVSVALEPVELNAPSLLLQLYTVIQRESVYYLVLEFRLFVFVRFVAPQSQNCENQ